MSHRDNEPCLACTLLGAEFAARKEAIARDLFAHADGIAPYLDIIVSPAR